MKAIITVGLGFGDEGKGAAVDFLVRVHGAGLVVRYSGGAQAGHNVVLPDGRRHSFSQFGAGTFAGASTWLGPRVILCPGTLGPEATHLKALGVADPFARLSVHPDCLLSTHYHVTANRLRELARGKGRHGSCGLGIGETRHYWLRYGEDAVVASDLEHRSVLIEKLTRLRERLSREVPGFDDVRPAEEAELLIEAGRELRLVRRPPLCETVIFEGAQGILLDERFGFHPHTTWSTVTSLHARELAAEWGLSDVEILGITRAYATRHGAGPLPTHSIEMTARLADPGNPRNDWQGTLRAGPLDLVLLRYAASVDRVDGLVVNGLDQLGPMFPLCRAYRETDALDVPRTRAEQEALTRTVEAATPVVEEATEERLLDLLGEIVPVRILGRGPSSRKLRISQTPRLESLIGS